jgi:glyoxylase-like metal-dependent hydrolase (beta-lactamase superfamily II)
VSGLVGGPAGGLSGGGIGGWAEPWAGGPGGGAATCVLAPNPGPLTLDGTNTWVLAAAGGSAVVVDPGPSDPGHLDRVLSAATTGGRRLALVLLTHGHADHAEGARALAERAAAPVRALDPACRLGDEGLAGGDVVWVDGLEVRVVATPGHTGDSLSFALPAEGALLTGDTVLGRGTSVVAHPEGRLGDYLGSLRRLQDESTALGLRVLLPGHGPALGDLPGVLAAYLCHREERLAQVAAAVAEGHTSGESVVASVYADVDRALWPAAALSVAAQLAYLGVPPDRPARPA